MERFAYQCKAKIGEIHKTSVENKELPINSCKEMVISLKPQLFKKIKRKHIKYVFTERALQQVTYKNKIY